MKPRAYAVIIFFLLLSACSPTPTPAPKPTAFPTLVPTATSIPVLISGTLFWDANGSGLQDETSFIVPDYDPEDPPYFFELLAANGTDTTAFVAGELTTVPESPISDMVFVLIKFAPKLARTAVSPSSPRVCRILISCLSPIPMQTTRFVPSGTSISGMVRL